jgi:hypothetical protein
VGRGREKVKSKKNGRDNCGKKEKKRKDEKRGTTQLEGEGKRYREEGKNKIE